jgi:hypothetical protein
MTCTIKVHALSRGGFFAETRVDGRTLSNSGATVEQALHRCALRACGISALVAHDGDESLLHNNDIRLRFLRTDFENDGEIFELETS